MVAPLSAGLLAAAAEVAAVGAAAEPGASPLIPLWADLAAVAVSALAGGLVAARERYDLNGVLFVAIATGLGGGIIRDLLIAQGPPLAMVSLWYLPTAGAAGLLVFFLSTPIHSLTTRARPVVFTLETVALALYTVLGAGKGLEAGLPLVSCVLLGVITGVGGGILRDLLLNRRPTVLQPGTLEAGAALIAAIAQVVADIWLPAFIAAIIGLAVAVLARAMSVLLRWQTPPAAVARRPE